MSRNKKMVVDLSEKLYNELNKTLETENEKKGDYIGESLVLYMEEKKNSILEQMKKGYKEMGEINLELSECGFDNYEIELEKYEAQLSECDIPDDNDNSEKRRYILC